MRNAFSSPLFRIRFSLAFSLLAGAALFPQSLAAQTSGKNNKSSRRPQAYLVTGQANPAQNRNSRFEASTAVTDAPPYRRASVRASKSYSPALARLEQQAFQILNQQRAKYKLPPLAWNAEVAEVARMHSENMARYGFLSHLGKDGSSVSERAGMLGIRNWRGIGENVAYNQGYENPAEFACQRWMISAKHRANVLEPRFKETGIGVSIAPDGTHYFTQVFLLR